jgi:hypothetical protein
MLTRIVASAVVCALASALQATIDKGPICGAARHHQRRVIGRLR